MLNTDGPITSASISDQVSMVDWRPRVKLPHGPSTPTIAVRPDRRPAWPDEPESAKKPLSRLKMPRQPLPRSSLPRRPQRDGNCPPVSVGMRMPDPPPALAWVMYSTPVSMAPYSVTLPAGDWARQGRETRASTSPP